MRPRGCEAQVVDPDADGVWALTACGEPARYVKGGSYGYWLCSRHAHLSNVVDL